MYVVALQRRAHNPQVTHVRRLNAVVRKLQHMPQLLVYRRMKPTGALDVHTDSGFAKETEHKGYSIRGSNVCRLDVNPKGETAARLIEPACRSHKLATRPTYAAELMAAAAGCDDALPIVVTLHEFSTGPLPARQAALLRENGGYCYRLLLTVDAMSVYHSIAALHLKAPIREKPAQPSVSVA